MGYRYGDFDGCRRRGDRYWDRDHRRLFCDCREVRGRRDRYRDRCHCHSHRRRRDRDFVCRCDRW